MFSFSPTLFIVEPILLDIGDFTITNISENEVLPLEAKVTNVIFGGVFMIIIRNKEGMIVHKKDTLKIECPLLYKFSVLLPHLPCTLYDKFSGS